MNSVRVLLLRSSRPLTYTGKSGQISLSSIFQYGTTARVIKDVKIAPLAPPKDEPVITVSTETGGDQIYDEKIVRLVDEISKLSLIQVADLNALLKKTLNIPDAPMMGMGFAAPVAAAPVEEEEAEAPKAVQTSFTLKLTKFDEGKKVALIKECKSLLEGFNLVQAKKFVESAPCVVKADIGKDEAEKLKVALEAVGATCEIS